MLRLHRPIHLVAALVAVIVPAHALAAGLCARSNLNGPLRLRATGCKPTEIQIGTFDGATLQLSGLNLQIVSGAGATDAPENGRGNLIVGYNGDTVGHTRSGSHNLVVGDEHSYSSYGGLVAGYRNTISNAWASVSGGRQNTASAAYGSVSGGAGNVAGSEAPLNVLGLSGSDAAAVSGGTANGAMGTAAAVCGGQSNTASGAAAAVSGGISGTASGNYASVTGGQLNVASGTRSAVNGGTTNTASTFDATVSGGGGNTASGFQTTVGGGINLSVSTNYTWHAVQSGGFPTGTQY